jgi:DNA-binding XRE family transcriptional regulator
MYSLLPPTALFREHGACVHRAVVADDTFAMKKKRLACYLGPYRRRWGFEQEEIAHLIGAHGQPAISRFEYGIRDPSLTHALALFIIFGTTPHELFPGFFAKVEESVMKRACELYEELQGNSSKATRAKLDLLENVFQRAEERKRNKSDP